MAHFELPSKDGRQRMMIDGVKHVRMIDVIRDFYKPFPMANGKKSDKHGTTAARLFEEEVGYEPRRVGIAKYLREDYLKEFIDFINSPGVRQEAKSQMHAIMNAAKSKRELEKTKMVNKPADKFSITLAPSSGVQAHYVRHGVEPDSPILFTAIKNGDEISFKGINILDALFGKGAVTNVNDFVNMNGIFAPKLAAGSRPAYFIPIEHYDGMVTWARNRKIKPSTLFKPVIDEEKATLYQEAMVAIMSMNFPTPEPVAKVEPVVEPVAVAVEPVVETQAPALAPIVVSVEAVKQVSVDPTQVAILQDQIKRLTEDKQELAAENYKLLKQVKQTAPIAASKPKGFFSRLLGL